MAEKKEGEIMFRIKRRLSVLGVVSLIVIALGAAPAVGIVYGEPDNGEHPYVGSIVAYVPALSSVPFQACTGTLVPGAGDYSGEDVLVTAAHCLVGWDFLDQYGEWEILVTFDETIQDISTGTFYDGTLVPHPNFPANAASNTYDIGVIVLNDNPGVGYGRLPEHGVLDDMKADHILREQTFTAVGYGTVRETRKMAFQSILDNQTRNKGDQEALSLTDAWLTLSMNEATGNSGTCYGDSGGPHFFEGTNVIASITVTGDAQCKATDQTYRLDSEYSQDFLAQFVALP